MFDAGLASPDIRDEVIPDHIPRTLGYCCLLVDFVPLRHGLRMLARHGTIRPHHERTVRKQPCSVHGLSHHMGCYGSYHLSHTFTSDMENAPWSPGEGRLRRPSSHRCRVRVPPAQLCLKT